MRGNPSTYRNAHGCWCIRSARRTAEGEEIKKLDERFEKILTARTVRVWESAAGDPFRDFGYPHNAGPDLTEDLQTEGF